MQKQPIDAGVDCNYIVTMKTSLVRVGNSRGVRIPKPVIEQCGFKGNRYGDAGVSDQHALVLVNHGNASGREILALATTIQSAVHSNFGVTLQPEPKVVNFPV